MDFYKTMKNLGLARLPCWTISDNLKRPIDPKTALRQHFNPETYQPQLAKPGDANYWGNLCNDPIKGLVSLDKLKKDEGTPKSGYALRINSEKQHVFLIDVENEYDHKINRLIKGLPIVYAEKSKHGGIHMIVYVSGDFFSDPIYQTVPLKSSYKIGTTKDEHSGAEIFFYNHYLTFTTNQIKVKKPGQDWKKHLIKLFDYLLNHQSTAHVESGNLIHGQDKKPSAIGDNDQGYVYDVVKRLENHLLTAGDKYEMFKLSQLYNDMNFTGDGQHPLGDTSQSRRDYMITFNLMKKIINQVVSNYYTRPIQFDGFQDKNHTSPTNFDLAYNPIVILWATYYMSNDYLKQRDKLNQIHGSNGQLYQQKLVQDAYDFATQKTAAGRRFVDVVCKHGYDEKGSDIR